MRAGRGIGGVQSASVQTAWSDDDAFPEKRRDFDDVTGMVSATGKTLFRRKP